jgi:single-strand DNA-binding protein
MSVNKVILVGNLGRDPEVRYLDNQKVVAQFSLATSETYTDKNGERKVDTEWHNVEMWDTLAKIAEKYLKKGSQVYIEGKIRSEHWRDKEGIERSGKKIRAVSITLLGSSRNNNADNSGNGTEPQQGMPAVPPPNLPEAGDDLPF